MATKFCQTNTLYLAGAGVIVGATSVTFTSLADIYGNVLTMTDFGAVGYGTLEPDTTNEEAFTFTAVVANANGTYTVTGVKTVLAKSPYTETSGLVRAHAGGAKAVITDNVAFWNTFGNKNNTGTWNAVQTFATGSTPIITDAPVSATEAANKGYVDGVAIAGGSNASSTVKGISKLSLDPVAPTNPIAVGDNDTRVPTVNTSTVTAGMVAALAGTSGTPAVGNKYVTDADTTGTGAVLRASSRIVPIYKVITATRNSSSDGTGTVNVAHGMGVIPKAVKVTATATTASTAVMLSIGTYDATDGNHCIATTDGVQAVGDTQCVELLSSGGNSHIATVTLDATNVIFAWVKSGTTTWGTIYLMIEAMYY